MFSEPLDLDLHEDQDYRFAQPTKAFYFFYTQISLKMLRSCSADVDAVRQMLCLKAVWN